ncbi:uncharacterized protein PFL1_04172 [Pseudozyma flocculosa PF-1]|uniref:Uncharacterized protein n=1 Tax=Pseudozyma flocculosa PF-1 TaxID=1277687 RepID=A0A061H8K4_9BASI|nr:uncharacterized protein PFL1_04172 [Pseudozyma flocculosa PF-1]EPQ28345.1 hypothetical protein PFL1_04172 [Pseudozyma flocculosa PF-1]
MFIVGKDEYVEFNESMGSKAFLEHIWDQSQTPLESRDVSAGHLHSTGARISPTPPPRIEFPTVYRVKGKGNTYRSSGKYISWDELARLNPLAVKAPPSLEEFQARGGQVGSGPRLKPGELLRRDEPMARIRKQASLVASKEFSEEDGWIGGSSASIYATAKPATPSPSNSSSDRKKQSTSTTPLQQPETPERRVQPPSPSSKPKSLFERLGIDEMTTPPPKATEPRQLRTTPSPGIRRPGAKIPSPLPLTSPARNNGPLSPGGAQTPLSASHPPPETPLKMSHRGGPQTPATPHHPLYAYSHRNDEDAARASGLGLGLTPHKPTIPLAHLGSPETRAGLVHDPAAPYTQSSDGSPSNAMKPEGAAPASAAGSTTSSTAGSQIEAMLERLRKARTGLGTEASMWAPKIASGTAPEPSSQPSSASKKSRSGTSGVAAAADKLSSAMGSGRNGESPAASGRRKPGHRHNGLQLSLGQGIEVMQNLDEKAEDELLGGKEERNDADVDGWLGNIVPPTPALGADSPQFDGGADGNERGSGSFWGTVASSPEAPRASLLSSRPSSRGKPNGTGHFGLQEVWSGDDDDEEDAFGRAANGQLRSNRNDATVAPSASQSQRAPPPSLSFKSKTPSPSRSQLDTSGAQDTTRLSPSPSALGAPRSRDGARSPSSRLSPSSLPSPLDDSDGDADVEDDADRASHNSRRSKPRSSPSNRNGRYDDGSSKGASSDAGRSQKGKRDASERKRGRRSSQSQETKGRDAADATSSDQKHSEVSPAKTPVLAAEESTGKAQEASPTLRGDSTEAALATGPKDAEPDAPTDSGTPGDAVPDVAAPSDGRAITPSAEGDAIHDPAKAEANELTPASAEEQRGSTPPAPSTDLPSSKTAEVEPAGTATEVTTSSDLAESSAVKEVSESESTSSKTVPRSESGIDWAADDDDIDDTLPDLDDWGITIPPTPSSKSTAQFASPSTSKPASEASTASVVAKGVERPHPQPPPQKPRAADRSGAGEARGPAWKRAERPPAPSALDSRKAQEPPKGPLGIRIAGRAAAAAAGDRTETAKPAARKELLDGARHSMHAQNGRPAEAAGAPAKSQPPPAATPYGRWKSGSGAAANPARGDAAAPATMPNPAEDAGITIKGNNGKHPTASSKGTLEAAGAFRRDRAAVRPRVAADSGAFARLVGGSVGSSASAGAAAAANGKHAPSVAAAAAKATARTPSPPPVAAAAATPKKEMGAAASMHAPRPASATSTSALDSAIVSAAAPAPSPAAKIAVRLPGSQAPKVNETSATAAVVGDAKSPRMPHGFEHVNGRRKSSGGRSGGGRSGGGRGGGGKKKR